MSGMNADVIGWLAAGILLLTILRQVWTQWRTRTTAGVSKWLFIGQLAASVLFTTYSYMVENWVFVATNSALVVSALLGEAIYLRNRRLTAREATGYPQDQLRKAA